MRAVEISGSHAQPSGALFEAEGADHKEDAVASRKADDWTIERWRTEPRWGRLEFDDTLLDPVPPLWRDLAVASIIAIVLWLAAAVVFG
jgi:hypothetical protein